MNNTVNGNFFLHKIQILIIRPDQAASVLGRVSMGDQRGGHHRAGSIPAIANKKDEESRYF
jgi:hypothetical protein